MAFDSRRTLLVGAASFAAWAYLPKFARASDGRDPRLVTISCAARLTALRPSPRSAIPIMRLCTDRLRFQLTVRMRRRSWTHFSRFIPRCRNWMYREKKAAVFHAVATPYRDRSGCVILMRHGGARSVGEMSASGVGGRGSTNGNLGLASTDGVRRVP